jgi:hypothetical protein
LEHKSTSDGYLSVDDSASYDATSHKSSNCETSSSATPLTVDDPLFEITTSYDSVYISPTSFSSAIDFYGIGQWVGEITLLGGFQGAGQGPYDFTSAAEVHLQDIL